ncbi:MAG: MFS transporter [Saccharospirillum sp.]|uniref:MFS transporter n=1 Tax=Saccharospirillum sp. TaxID=2033801 RepID=UPI0034A003DE
MNKPSPALWTLIAMQALSMCAPPMVILIGGLIGTQLAPNPQLATLPLSVLVVATALSTFPTAMIMQRLGRKVGFLIGNLVSIVACGLAILAIYSHSFALLLVATAGLGFNMAFVNQFRFAAMERVAPEDQGQAVSWLLLGGIFAALVGPELGALGESLLGAPYAGAFLLLAGVLLGVTLLILLAFKDLPYQAPVKQSVGRPWGSLLQQPVLWLALLAGAVSYSVMTLVMTAAPLSMHDMDQHSLQATKTVIQAHILAMFLPSLATSWLIKRFGPERLLMLGLLIYALMIIAGLSGRGISHYSTSLILLGVGWNFLFVSGTTLLPRAYQDSERFRVQAVNEFLVFGAQALATLGAGWLLFQFSWEVLLYATLPALVVLSATQIWHRHHVKTMQVTPR